METTQIAGTVRLPPATPTARPGHRIFRKAFGLALLAGLLAGCSRNDPQALQQLYAAAQADLLAMQIAKLQTVASRGLELATKSRDMLYEWKFRLLRAEADLNSNRPKQVLEGLNGPMPASPEFAPLAARRLLLEGRATAKLKKLEDGKAILDQARAAAEASHSEDVLAEIDVLEAAWLIRTEHREDAEKMLRTAVARAHGAGAAQIEAQALVNLGYIQLSGNRYDAAMPYFERAGSMAGPESAVHWQAKINLAVCYERLGDYENAIRINRETIERFKDAGAENMLQQALGQLGRTLVLSGDPQHGFGYLARALSATKSNGQDAQAAIWASNLATFYIERRDWDKAADANDESLRLRRKINSPAIYYNELNAAEIAVGRGDHATAVKHIEAAMKGGHKDPLVLWNGEEQLGRIALAQHRSAEAVRHFETAVSVIERTRSKLERDDLKLPFLNGLMGLYRQYSELLLEQGQVEGALAVADSSRAQVLAGRAGSEPARRLPPGAFREIARKTNSIQLCYWIGPKKSHLWLVTPAEVRHFDLPPAGEIEPLVSAYQEAVEHQLSDPARTRLPAGERLFQILVEPVRQWVRYGSNVVISADGALNSLNFESLPIPGEGGRYWIQDVNVSIAPALALLDRPRSTPPRKRLLLLGDPAGADPSFGPLPYASREIAAIRSRSAGAETVVVSGEHATPDAYAKANPGSFSTIHFAAHATANREMPLDSGVLLAGGKLYARDVMGLHLSADLVTVSACRGVGVRMFSGEGLVGFTWAFLHAGARNVIAGLWDVNDQSTSALMDALYRELAAGKTPAAALHIAKISLVESKGNLRKPYYWAPFQLYTVSP